MSETTLHVGKIVEIAKDCETMEETMEFIKKEYNIKDNEIKYNWNAKSFYHNRFIYINNKMYEIFDTEIKNYCTLTKVKDGEYKYSTRLYDGGTCLKEMLDLEDELREPGI